MIGSGEGEFKSGIGEGSLRRANTYGPGGVQPLPSSNLR
jgi:hypothetical protein